MLDISLFNFFNILFTGIILMVSINSIIIGCKALNPKLHALFWLVIFCYLLLFNLEYTQVIDLRNYYSDYLLFFIPACAFFYIFSLYYQKRLLFALAIFAIPIIACMFKNKIPLFSLFYDLVTWIAMSGFSFYYALKHKGTDKDNRRLTLYILFWVLIVAGGYIPYVLINLTLSIIRGYPIQIFRILPSFIALSSLIVLFLHYKTSLYYNNETIKKSSIFDKQSLIEKIAASLIHEIKNPVAAISSLTQQLQMNIENMNTESVQKYLTIMTKDLDRVKDLADSFMKTYKRDLNNKEETDLFLVTQSVYTLIKFDLIKKEIKFDIDKSLLNLKVYMGNYQFRQILLNLFYNSIEAQAKFITIKAQETDQNIDVTIEDDGEGIKQKDQKNIFNPFYTTKDDGIGIGLAICQKIVEDYNGKLNLVVSRPGKTIFTLSLKKILPSSNET